MKRLGHQDIRTTYNTYGHMFPSDEAAFASMFAEPDAPEGARIEAAGLTLLRAANGHVVGTPKRDGNPAQEGVRQPG